MGWMLFSYIDTLHAGWLYSCVLVESDRHSAQIFLNSIFNFEENYLNNHFKTDYCRTLGEAEYILELSAEDIKKHKHMIMFDSKTVQQYFGLSFDGCMCVKCNEWYLYSEPSEDDGFLICYSCKSYAAT